MKKPVIRTTILNKQKKVLNTLSLHMLDPVKQNPMCMGKFFHKLPMKVHF